MPGQDDCQGKGARRQEPSTSTTYLPGACQAEVTDFKVAVCIHEQVAWFEVSVEDVG